MIEAIIEAALHFDEYLQAIVRQYGGWSYGMLFLIIFAETGLVVMPFLPGDSLLFAVGALAAAGSLDLFLLLALLAIASIIGDSVNYALGKYLHQAIMRSALGRFIKPAHLERTHRFYERYGGKTIILARFVPIVRTFAPFVAGVGNMRYAAFALYNVTGGILWVGSLVLAGYYFGNIPVIKENFTLAVLGIVAVSLLPGIVGYLWHCLQKRTATGRVADNTVNSSPAEPDAVETLASAAPVSTD